MIKYLTKRKLEGRDPGMAEVTGTSHNWNASFWALIKRFQAVGGGGFLSVLGCVLQKSDCRKTELQFSGNLKNYFVIAILYKTSNLIL